jgi:hypothetical protein
MIVKKFMASFGQEIKEVDISLPLGNHGGYQLMVDHYYYGRFIEYLTGWQFQGNEKAEAELTTADREILLGIVIAHKQANNPEDF